MVRTILDGIFLFLIICNVGFSDMRVKKQILGPAVANKPFVVAWNVATDGCAKFGVDIDLTDFDIVYNPDKSWKGSALTIFYGDQIGLYPHFTPDGKAFHGGIPQMLNMTAHVEKAIKDINEAIPDKKFQGPAVLDWEGWLPQFDRCTYGPYLIYREKSIEKVKIEHPDWTKDQQTARAEFEYNTAAKAYFEVTLSLAKGMRPHALWGIYLFPDCYNYAKNGTNFNCSDRAKAQNDEIQWVFDDSTALYPSVYLGEWFKNDKYAIDYVANRVREAMRVDSNRKNDISIPVFPYHSIVYRKQSEFVGIVDLRDSIGIASLLGSSGMVIWGDHNIANSKKECRRTEDYITSTLGPYCKATSDAATKCSQRMCNSHGRCVLTMLESGINGIQFHRLLNEEEAIELLRLFGHELPEVLLSGAITGRRFFDHPMKCQCFTGWKGESCDMPDVY